MAWREEIMPSSLASRAASGQFWRPPLFERRQAGPACDAILPVCYRTDMPADPHVDHLMAKLVQAVRVSLRATEAAREALAEILKRGAETGIFFVRGRGGEKPGGFELTDQDRDFLRSLSIRPDRE